jgi:hypothetical protein
MKGISRIDSPRCHGWFVRVYRGNKVFSKLFSDGKYGGKAEARKLAAAFHAKLEHKTPKYVPPPKPPFRLSGKVFNNNSTGINGVSATYTRVGGKKKVIHFSVHYKLEGAAHNKRFSVENFANEKTAFKEAKSFRLKMERAMLKEWKQKLAKKKKTARR